MNVLFLLPTREHARFRKRLNFFLQQDVETEVMAFERELYPAKELPCGYISLGKIRNRHYLRRIVPYIKAMRKIRKGTERADAIYCFGLDILLLGWISSIGYRRTLIYEVGDIRELLLGGGPGARITRCVERFLFKKTALTIVTSRAFVENYFCKIQRLEKHKFLVLENKLERGLTAPAVTKKTYRHGSLTIGYFGVLRCARSLKNLEAVVSRSAGKSKVYLRGVLVAKEVKQLIQAYPNQIVYGGPYVSPDDLPDLYGKVDLVWAAYSKGEQEGNSSWALPNRFYEACFFKKPLIVQANTFSSEQVENFDIGISLDMSSKEEIRAEEILNISSEDIERWTANLGSLPEDVFLYKDEAVLLVSKVRKAVAKSSKCVHARGKRPQRHRSREVSETFSRLEQ